MTDGRLLSEDEFAELVNDGESTFPEPEALGFAELINLVRQVDEEVHPEAETITTRSTVVLQTGGVLECDPGNVILRERGATAVGISNVKDAEGNVVEEDVSIFIPYANLGFVQYNNDDLEHEYEAAMQAMIAVDLESQDGTDSND